MKLLNKKTMNFIDEKSDFYKLDFLNSQNRIIELFNMLKVQNFNVTKFFIRIERDHTMEEKPIECYSNDELALVLSQIDINEIDEIGFNGIINNTEFFGVVTPKSAILNISISEKKII